VPGVNLEDLQKFDKRIINNIQEATFGAKAKKDMFKKLIAR